MNLIFKSKKKTISDYRFVIYIGLMIFIILVYIITNNKLIEKINIKKILLSIWLVTSGFITLYQHTILSKKMKMPMTISPETVLNNAKKIKEENPMFYKVAYYNMWNFCIGFSLIVAYLIISGKIKF